MEFVKLSGKYIEIHYDAYNWNIFWFELVETVQMFGDSHYLSRNQFKLLGEYNPESNKFTVFDENKLLIVNKKFNDFVIKNCVEYENFYPNIKKF